MKKISFLRPATELSAPVELAGPDLLGGLMALENVLWLGSSVSITRLIESLQATINQFPLLSGRLLLKDKKLYVDRFASGVKIEILDVSEPSPQVTKGIFSLDSYHPISEELDQQYAFSESPLAAFRVLRYSDGIVGLGTYLSHAVTDSNGYIYFLKVWSENYAGRSAVTPDFDRTPIREISNNREVPSGRSGFILLKNQEDIRLLELPMKVEEFKVLLSKERLDEMNSSLADSEYDISINNILHALILKSHAKSKKEGNIQHVRLNFFLDLRRISGLGISRYYFGNCFLTRTSEFSTNEIIELSVYKIADLIKEKYFKEVDSIKDDLGFLQSEYEKGNFHVKGGPSSFFLPNLNGGITINNFSQKNNESDYFSFGGEIITWNSVRKKPELGVRNIVIKNNEHGEIVFDTLLPKTESQSYKSTWTYLLEEIS